MTFRLVRWYPFPLGGRVRLAGMLAAALATAPAAPALAEEPLRFPVDCQLGTTCFIQNYVDRAPGRGVQDFTCGSLSYNGHNGTDIRLATDAEMHAGVDVLSASSGTVLGVRDGMPDIRPGAAGAPDIKGRECGNGVLIGRADGWRLQYCHLREGSVTVSKGQEVRPGDVLGQIGLSGRTQFPHLHFTVRDQAGRVFDPFDARQQDEACSLPDRRTLWRDLDAGDYQPGAPLSAGFSEAVPPYRAVKTGEAAIPTLAPEAPALVFWAHFFGLQAGDRIELDVTGPDGQQIATKTHRMGRDRATQMLAVGRKRRGDWPAGTYHGEARLVRDGEVYMRIARSIPGG